ncbi:hypothetical protein D3C71_1662370 [compost metagenome]
MLEGLANGVAHARHSGFTAPEEAGQGAVGTQEIDAAIGGHLLPVEGADKLAPAEDLANEALHLRERNGGLVGPPTGLGGADHLEGVEHLAVERK